MSDDPPPPDSARWREPIAAFGVVVAGLAAVSVLASVWAPMASYLLLVAAAIFIAVPYVILRRSDADFRRFGIDLDEIPLKHIGLGLAVCAVIFPLYAVGYHVWETSFQERDFEPAVDNYRQWPVELDTPSVTGERDRAIQIRTFANRLHLEWTDTGEPATSVLVEGDRRFRWRLDGDLSAIHGDPHWFDEPDAIPAPHRARGVEPAPWKRWLIAPAPPSLDGRLILTAPAQVGPDGMPNRLEFRVLPLPDTEPPQVYVGTSRHPPDEAIVIERTHWWLLLWALTHLLLIALPEEYFYRGYLQTRFSDLFGDTDDPTTFLGISRANFLTSGLFAVGHVLVPVAGSFSLARASVFFPSLLFGWLRERTGSIIASTVFHAGANMMVLVLAVHYF